MRSVNSSTTYPIDAECFPAIDGNLTKWCNEVDEYMESNDTLTSPISSFQKTILVVLRHESTIALNRTVLATSKKDSTYNAALQVCIGASRSIINHLHGALTIFEEQQNSAASEHTLHSAPLLWPSFTWAVWMSAFVMIHAASEEQVPVKVTLRYLAQSWPKDH